MLIIVGPEGANMGRELQHFEFKVVGLRGCKDLVYCNLNFVVKMKINTNISFMI